MKQIPALVRRNSISIAFIIIALCLACILLINAVTMARLRDQVSASQQIIRQLQRNSQAAKARSETTNRHLDCMVLFFQQNDRTNLTISDVNKCTFSKGQVILTPSQQSLNSSPGPTQIPTGSQNNIKTPTNQNENQTSTPTTAVKPVQGAKPAREVLGIPICIPFTDHCARQ